MSWQFCMYACTHMQTTLKGAGFHSVNRATLITLVLPTQFIHSMVHTHACLCTHTHSVVPGTTY